MGVLSDIRAAWSAPSVSDDGHWSTLGGGAYGSSSGVVITEQTALSNPVVFDCVENILAATVGQTPTILYDRGGGDGSERHRSDTALAYRLREQPNDEQGAYEFKLEMQRAACFYPHAYAEIQWRGAEPVNIWPRHPLRMRVETTPAGKRYSYLEDDGVTRRAIVPANVLRIPGRPVLRYAGETLGRALALERYSSRLFGRGVRPSALISTSPEETWSDTAKQKLKDEIEGTHGGPENAGGLLIMDGRLKWTSMAMTNQEAELASLLSGIIGDLARWWRIPPYMLGLLESGTVSYASVNTQSVDFVVYCLMPWLVGWEQAMQRDLIVDKRGRFVEFLTAQLMRGTTKERFDVYRVAITNGIMSPNEVRRLENMNDRPGGDSWLHPVTTYSDDVADSGGARAIRPEAGSPADRLLRTFAQDTAGRVIRREQGALAKVAEKAGMDAHAWESGVREFYGTHGTHVAEVLHLPPTAAASWADEQLRAVLAEGPAAIATWNGQHAEKLATLALTEGIAS